MPVSENYFSTPKRFRSSGSPSASLSFNPDVQCQRLERRQVYSIVFIYLLTGCAQCIHRCSSYLQGYHKPGKPTQKGAILRLFAPRVTHWTDGGEIRCGGVDLSSTHSRLILPPSVLGRGVEPPNLDILTNFII